MQAFALCGTVTLNWEIMRIWQSVWTSSRAAIYRLAEIYSLPLHAKISKNWRFDAYTFQNIVPCIRTQIVFFALYIKSCDMRIYAIIVFIANICFVWYFNTSITNVSLMTQRMHGSSFCSTINKSFTADLSVGTGLYLFQQITFSINNINVKCIRAE